MGVRCKIEGDLKELVRRGATSVCKDHDVIKTRYGAVAIGGKHFCKQATSWDRLGETDCVPSNR